MRKKLTDLVVANLKDQGYYWDTSFPAGGFGVWVGAKRKTFVLKQGNTIRKLGHYLPPAFTLAMARETAKHRLIEKYLPPGSIRIGQAVDAYLEAKKSEHRPASQYTYNLYLKRLPRDRLVSSIRARDITELSSTLTRSGAVIAHKVYKAFFNWCVQNEHITSNPLLGSKSPHRVQSRDRLLTDAEVKFIWAESHKHSHFGTLIRLSFLTGQRIGQWKAYRIIDNSIVFDASAMKGRIQHIIPATQLVIDELLGFELPRDPSTLMIGFRQTLPQIADKYTLHDTRRYLSSTMAKLKVPQEVTERILAHKTSGVHSAISLVYNRYAYESETREAYERYHAHLLAIMT